MNDLPAWVYDVVIAQQEWADMHPKLYGEFYSSEAGKHVMQRVDDCGCKPLEHVPVEVQAEARAMARYLQQRKGDQEQIEQLTKQRDAVEKLVAERSESLAKALGLEHPKQFEFMAEQVAELRRQYLARTCNMPNQNEGSAFTRHCTLPLGHEGEHSDGVDWW